jgi:mannose-6-phosphate isomerase-like protein (cupin superfamily)
MGARVAFDDAYAALPTPEGQRFVQRFNHGSLSLELYAPRSNDPQQPHARDELYVVVHGHGEFVCDGERTAFAAGDALFVAAGAKHRFERFSDDLAVWVMFYGPQGGEAA